MSMPFPDWGTALLSWLVLASGRSMMLVLMLLFLGCLFRDWIAPRARCWLWFLPCLGLLAPTLPESSLSIYNLMPALGGVPEEVKIGVAALGGPLPESHFDVELKLQSLLAFLEWTWLVGLLATAIWLALPAWRLLRVSAAAKPVSDPQCLELLERCREAISCRGVLSVAESAHVSSPLLTGILRPRLLLPLGLRDSLSEEDLRAIFLHELAHMKRHDLPVNAVAGMLLCAHWFNPLLWLGFRAMREDQELACDQMAIASMGPSGGYSYGVSLLKLVECVAPPRMTQRFFSGILEDHGQLRRRIQMITRGHDWNIWRLAVPLALMLLMAGVGLTGQVSRENETAGIRELSLSPLPMQAWDFLFPPPPPPPPDFPAWQFAYWPPPPPPPPPPGLMMMDGWQDQRRPPPPPPWI